MFVFRLSGSSGVPTYLQLVQQVRQAVVVGVLRPGDQLPLIREVAGALAINPNTVAKAYRQLELEGLTRGQPGQGTFVSEAAAPVVPPAVYGALRRRLEVWLRSAVDAGLTEDALDALISDVRVGLAQEGVA